MNKNNHTTKDHSHSGVAEHTNALIEATTETAGEMRNRLAHAFTAAKDTCVAVQEKAVDTAKATDKMIRRKPYQAMGIAFGVGALLGFLMSRRGRDRSA